jgi:hypothetical protein
MRWVGLVTHGEKTHNRVLVGKSAEKKPLGRPMRRNEDNIKRGLKK